jgi:hypothetical protein
MIIFYYLIFFVVTFSDAASPSPWSEKPLSRQAISKNAFSNATEAVQKGDFLNAFKNWYPQLVDHDREVLLSFIFQHKTPKDLSGDEIKLFEEKAVALRKVFPDFASPLIITAEWKGALPSLFPPSSAKVVPLVEEERKKAEVVPQKKYVHKITVFEHEQPTYAPLTLSSSDGVEVLISRKIAQNCWISRLLCTTLEEDPKASKIEIKIADGETLKRIVYLMKNLAHLIDAKPVGETLTPIQKKELVGTMFGKFLQVKSEDRMRLRSRMTPLLLKAAHYLDSPILEAAFALDYVLYLTQLRTRGETFHPGITKEVAQHNFPIPVLQSINKQAFLFFDYNFDLEFGLLPKHRTIISLEELKLWKKIPDILLKYFPNLESNPQEVAGQYNVFEYVLEKMPHLNDQAKAKIITALTRLKNTNLDEHVIRDGGLQYIKHRYNDGDIITSLPHEFLIKKEVETTTALLRSGANPSNSSQNALLIHDAAVHGNPSLIKLLEHLGADINQGNRMFKFTPLMLAVEEGHLDNVNALLELHAQTKLKNTQGRTALMLAVIKMQSQKKSSNQAIVATLLPYVDMKYEQELMLKAGMQKGLDMIHRYLITNSFE